MLHIKTHCMRCQLELTDPASIEYGIGPECRSKANHILAQEIPTAWDAESLGAILFLTKDSWPTHVQPIFEEVWQKIVEAKSFNSSEEYLKTHALKEDWRATVQKLAWLGSFTALKETIRHYLASIIKGLGYPQYANFMLKIASASEGTLWLEPGFVKFSGVKNMEGVKALKTLNHVGARAEKELVKGEEHWVWRCPIKHVLAFIDIVKLYWPLTDTQAILKKIMELDPKDAIFDEVIEQPNIQIKDFNYTQYLVIAKPYNNGFYNAIKNMPFKNRKWDTFNGGWLVNKKEKFYLEDILKKHYNVLTVRWP